MEGQRGLPEENEAHEDAPPAERELPEPWGLAVLALNRLRTQLRAVSAPQFQADARALLDVRETALGRIRRWVAKLEQDPKQVDDPELAAIVDGFEELVVQFTAIRAEEGPPPKAEAPTQFKMTLPTFSGSADELHKWKTLVQARLRAGGLTSEDDMFGVLADGALLPEALRRCTSNADSWQEFWRCLELEMPFRKVRDAVCAHLADLPAITRMDDHAQVTAFTTRVSDFNKRCVERKRVHDVDAWFVVHFVLARLGPLKQPFFAWEDANFDEESTSVGRLETFLRKHGATLSPSAKQEVVEARSDPIPKEAATSSEAATTGGTPTPAPVQAGASQNGFSRRNRRGGANGKGDSPREGQREEEQKTQDKASVAVRSATATAPETASEPLALGFKHANATDGRYLPVTTVMAKAEASTQGAWVPLRCLVDEGCDTTLISTEAATKLGFPPAQSAFPIKLSFFGGQSQTTDAATRAVRIRGRQGDCEFRAVVCELAGLKESVRGCTVESDPQGPHLQEARQWVPATAGSLDMVLGYDLKCLALPQEVRHGGPEEPVAVATRIGWLIVPPMPPTAVSESADQDVSRLEEALQRRLQCTKAVNIRRAQVQAEEEWNDPDQDLTAVFRAWCQADALGVAPTRRCACTPAQIEEADFVRHVRQAMRLVDGRVQVPLPWRPGYPGALRNNRDHVAVLQQALMQRVDKAGAMDAYVAEMQLVVDEFSELVPEKEARNPQAWYLVHFLVQNRSKVRIVWNAARKSRGRALNDGLFKGPSLLSEMPTVIVGFRLGPVGVVGDIRKMYNQVQLCPRDRDYHRFVWRGEDRRWTRLVFGDRPAPDLAIAALRFLADRADAIRPEAARILRNCTYMDDIMFAAESVEEAMKLQHDVEEILAQGSFAVKGWAVTGDAADEEETSVLGMRWIRSSDQLAVRPLGPPPSAPLTKRKILAWLSSLWDPLGLVAPLTVETKIRFQAMWDCALGWDDRLEQDDEQGWAVAFQALTAVKEVTIPRRLAGAGPASLHVFCDAGRDAYGAVAYVESGREVSFVEAKTQVAPLKTQTVPRLELMAVVLGFRLVARMAKTGLRLERRVVWTDSKTVQQWVASQSRRLKAFAAARVAEVHELQAEYAVELRRLPTELNPADCLTKVKMRTTEQWQEWIAGPAFLRSEDWPDEQPEGPPGEEAAAEVRLRAVSAVDAGTAPDDVLVRLSTRISRWRKQRRVLAWMLAWLQEGAGDQQKRLERAHVLLVRHDQRNNPPKVQKGLTLFVDKDQVIRASGRLGGDGISDRMARPMVLAPRDLATAMITEYHQLLMHCPARQVLHHLHSVEGILVSKGKTLAQRVVASCPICRRTNQRLHPQPLAPLPDDRFAQGRPPFTTVSVDFLETPGRRRRKRDGLPALGALFMIIVCDVTRAVHLELTKGEGAEEVAKAWTRFVCRRGVWPARVVADGGRGLVRAAKDLTAWHQRWAKAVALSTPEGVAVPTFEWRTGVPKAPHRMGVVEAMVKSVKRALKAGAAACRMDTHDDWETLACKAAFLINSRPCDPSYWSDLTQTPITANQVLFPYGGVTPIEQDPHAYRKEAEEAVETFWKAWQVQVPPQLLPRQRWEVKPTSWLPGDIVLLRQLQTGAVQLPRGSWPTARIVKCHPGPDGVVRRMSVRLASGKRKMVVPHHLVLVFRPESTVEAESDDAAVDSDPMSD